MATNLFTVPQADNASALTAVEGGNGGDPKNMSDSPQEFPDEEVRELARSLSRHSEAGRHLPWEADENSILNPASPNFNAREWVKAVLKLQAENPEAPGRTTGIAFTNLQAYGTGGGLEYQQTVSNLPIKMGETVKEVVTGGGNRVQILEPMDGLVRSGEMLVVLGPPGSGCSTLLKTFAGETDGFKVEGSMNYKGISQKEMATDLRGEAIYSAEVDVHFPQLTVGDTLYFAAKARSPRHPPAGLKTNDWATHLRDVIMAIFGISHTINTMVGNDFIRGVSGGERKRVSIAEAVLAGAPLQLWDNSTRGLDSANAIEFCKTLRMASDLAGTVACVAIYQAPGAAYDCFDKVSVLYQGRQIYFGKTTEAKQFFLDLGFHCPSRQTTADFLTSLTSDLERQVQDGWKGPKPPVTPDEFQQRWKASDAYARLQKEIAQYNDEFAIGGPSRDEFLASRRAQQTKGARAKSPYILSFGKQLELCTWRGFRRLVGNPEITITQLIGNFLMALIISSVFYNLPQTTSSFQRRGVLLFFAILLAAFASMLEILTLYAQRPIVDKHARYAFYHPSAEAFASMLCDMPYKISNSILFSLTLYFMTNLRREPGPYFFFLLITFTLTMVMSMIFRTIAASSRTLTQALCPAALLILGLVIFTGYVIPTPDMLGWCRWINYLDPISYGFEALMVNEFHNQNYQCDSFVPSGPGYEAASGLNIVCSSVGSVAGSSIVNGDDYINTAYQYYHSHKWRNFGILIAFTLFFMGTYLAASEFISGQKSKGEVLLFQRAELKKIEKKKKNPDLEAGLGQKVTRNVTGQQADVSMIPKQTAIFQWEDMVYDIKIKGEPRRILDHVDGWVKPGTLTALMGVSGAGKTTLLDVLAQRVTMGVVTGKALVDGRQRDDSFQRKTGYVQQQDLHLATSTVREALTFSALLRQPAHVSKEEKLEYVEEVIDLLEMRPYADAVIGVPGEGLNVEQRKRTTIGVELAAKPQLLLFLDEPTSGLDSQTSWAICDLLTKLAEHGQAILCTIHQPSAMLFSRFDRLLFLAKGGKTIYFGPVGKNSHVLIDYFQRNGAFACPEEANPAEWMLEVIGAAPGSHSDIDWHQTWRGSDEFRAVKEELHELERRGQAVTGEQEKMGGSEASSEHGAKDGKATAEFAASLPTQFFYVTKRVFEQYWRTPSYIYSKMALTALSGLFVGFVFFKANLSQQGLQNQMFSIFMILTIFGNLVQQIMPLFGTQRALYEVRERPSKTYSWIIFMLSNIVVEIPFNAVAATLIFLCYYYPVGLYNNATPTGTVAIRGFLFWLFTQQFLLFTSTFTHMVVAGMESIETAGNIAQLLFSLTLIFCGVLAQPGQFPQFWIFLYRLSPFTYLVEGFLTVGLANTSVTCSSIEYLTMDPPAGETCGAYLAQYLGTTGGYLLDEGAMSNCQVCTYSSTNTFLSLLKLSYDNRWRDYGLLWVYIVFNIAAALGIYWLARVPKKSRAKEAPTVTEVSDEKK